MGLISDWTGVLGVFGELGVRAGELGERRGTVSPDSDAADANRLLPLTPLDPEAALVTFDPEVGLGLPLLVLLVEFCCREKRHNKIYKPAVQLPNLWVNFMNSISSYPNCFGSKRFSNVRRKYLQ